MPVDARKMRCRLAILVTCIMSIPVLGAKTVTVTGQSAISEQAAVRDALRNAVEQGGTVQLDSQSTVSDFQLVSDIVQTRANGLVRSHEVLGRERSVDGVYTVRVKAVVIPDLIDATWADVNNLMKQLGQPTITLIFDDLKQAAVPTGSPDDVMVFRTSQVANQVAKVLTESNFRVIKKSRQEIFKQKTMAGIEADGRFDLLKAADKEDADLYIEGTFVAEGPRFLKRSGLYEWQTIANCNIFWSDSGELVSVPDLTSHKKNYSSPGDANGIKLLSFTALAIGEEIKFGLLSALARRAVDGGVINIKIDNVEPERQFTIEDYLAATENVSNVKVVTRHETAVVFDVKTKLLRQALERKLMRAKFDGFKLGFPQVVGRTIVFNAKDTKK